MRRFLLSALAVWALAFAAVASGELCWEGPEYCGDLGPPGWYGWKISASSENPDVHFTTATGELETYYLWIYCARLSPPRQQGMTAAAFAIESLGPIHVATIAQNGFLNAGTTSDLLLAAPGCPSYALAASLEMISLPGTVSLAPNPMAS